MARKALVVEDDAVVGRLLAEHVRRRGFEPIVLQEGKPALTWARQHRPDLILLDLTLPDLDGYDVCKQLKLEPDTNLIPLIMVTARDRHEDEVRGLVVGANAYLTKPFTPGQLYGAIETVLGWREALQRSGAEGEIHFQLHSDTRYLEQLNRLLSGLFLFSGLPQAQARQLTTAVGELGTNAIEWGHRHQVERVVTATYRLERDRITIVIRDTGPGFDPGHLPHAARSDDPTSHLAARQERGLREGGFGIMIARGLVDELQYNEAGNEVRLVKYIPARTDADACPRSC